MEFLYEQLVKTEKSVKGIKKLLFLLNDCILYDNVLSYENGKLKNVVLNTLRARPDMVKRVL